MNTVINTFLGILFFVTYNTSLAACIVSIVKIKHDCQPQNGKSIHRALIIRDGIFIIVTFVVGIATFIGVLHSLGIV